MLRTFVRLTPALIPILGGRHENDYNLLDRKPSSAPETGMDRVKKLFYRNEYDEISVEMRTVVQSGLCGSFFGACLGGFVKSREAYLYFIENNQATIFTTTVEAKIGGHGSAPAKSSAKQTLPYHPLLEPFRRIFRPLFENLWIRPEGRNFRHPKKLQEYVTLGFARGAYHWGWRLGIFTGTFSLIATTISVYRDETSITEYILAGTLTGAMYKANLGMAAMLVGAGLGAVLSTVGGLLVLGLLNVTGVSMNDIRKAMNKINEARVDQFNKAKEKAAEIKNDSLTRHHDALVQDKGEVKIDNL